MSNNANIGYLFSRLMYLDNDMNEQTSANNRIALDVIKASPMNQTEADRRITLDDIPGTDEFTLQVVYPGLYCGLGYAHGIGGSEDTADYKTGFYFDHTSGLPVIPGSSVKGVLRSAITQYPELIFNDQERRILNLTREAGGTPNLILDLFGSENKHRPAQKGRAIFFDAFPCARQDGYMADDYITPHKKRTAAPNPIHTLKVKPDVKFCFRFRLPDLLTYGKGEEILTITKDELLTKFKLLLINVGLGAKTNTGYGYFVESSVTRPATTNVQPQQRAANTHMSTDDENIFEVVVDKRQIDEKTVKLNGIMPCKLIISSEDKEKVMKRFGVGRTVKIRVKLHTDGSQSCDFLEIVS